MGLGDLNRQDRALTLERGMILTDISSKLLFCSGRRGGYSKIIARHIGTVPKIRRNIGLSIKNIFLMR